jgi:hypothetical protein
MESLALYKAANTFFFIFHIGLIFFNLFGWIPRPTRKWNLITLLLTAFSWFILGIFYGFGYCFLTDWHWQIRDKLGYASDSNSYIHFLLTSLTPISIEERIVDVWTAVFFFLALALSSYVNVRDWRRRKAIAKDTPER